VFEKNNRNMNRIAGLALLGVCCIPDLSRADATLVYQTVTDKGDRLQHTISITGRFVRVDMDTEPDRYWVIDAGLLTRADVDTARQRYTFEKLPRGRVSSTPPAATSVTTPAAGVQEPEAGKVSAPALSPDPDLSPTRKKRNVAQILCRVVREVHDGNTVAEHCMAGTGPLGLTSREMVTLSRLFTLARRLRLGWAGVATADERIASIDSRLPDGTTAQTLLSISYDPIPDERMQVPKRFKRVTSLQPVTDAPVPATTADAAPAATDGRGVAAQPEAAEPAVADEPGVAAQPPATDG
jgi:hypothetical protein